ncbi:hypothetical protein VTK26DRAFT_2349 [Humicola hyalothermophila]
MAEDGQSIYILPSDIPVVEEEGRKYYDPDKYLLPNNEQEQEYLDILHKQHLEPGGYFEVKDILLTPKCNDRSLKGDSYLLTWARLLAEAADKMGRPINLASRYREMLVEAGFTNVEVVEQKWPTNGWAKDSKLRKLGLWSLETFAKELETISTALLRHGLGWG